MDPRYIQIEIKGSPGKLIGLGLLGLAMVALCAGVGYMAYSSVTGSIRDHYSRLGVMGIGMFGTLFFGWTTWISFSRFFSAGKTLITLNRQGIHDKRVSEKPIPWDAISDVGVWEMSGQKIIVLAVLPEVEQSIGLSRMTKWTRGANRSLGADGISISSTGLEMKHADLLPAILARVNAAR